MTEQAILGEIVDIESGYLSRGPIQPKPQGSHCIVQLRDFDDTRSTVRSDALTRFTPTSSQRPTTLQDGDVLFLAKGTRGFAWAVAKLPVPTVAASYFFVLRPTAAVDPAFLVWFLNHDATRRALALKTGSGVRTPVVRRDALENLSVPLPSLTAQCRIVELLELARTEDAQMRRLAERRRYQIAHATMRIASDCAPSAPSHGNGGDGAPPSISTGTDRLTDWWAPRRRRRSGSAGAADMQGRDGP